MSAFLGAAPSTPNQWEPLDGANVYLVVIIMQQGTVQLCVDYWSSTLLWIKQALVHQGQVLADMDTPRTRPVSSLDTCGSWPPPEFSYLRSVLYWRFLGRVWWSGFLWWVWVVASSYVTNQAAVIIIHKRKANTYNYRWRLLFCFNAKPLLSIWVSFFFKGFRQRCIPWS